MRDILANESQLFIFVINLFDKLMTSVGSKKIILPVVESHDLFKRAIGQSTDIVEKEMFVIKSGESDEILALRPEMTAGCLRAYLENGLFNKPQPVILHSSGSNYRRERPQNNRYREFTQLNLEVLGSDLPVYDYFVIDSAMKLLRNLQLNDVVLSINSIGCNDCRPNFRQKLLDFLSKKKDDLCGDCQRRLSHNPLRILDCKENSCQNITQDAPSTLDNLCSACEDHFKKVIELIKLAKISYKENPKLVRGLDYYNRTVFEFNLESDNTRQGSLGGGGRYDYLATLISDQSKAAVGVALGVDRIVNALNERGFVLPDIATVALICSPEIIGETFNIYSKISDKINVRFLPSGKSISAQLSELNKNGFDFAIIIGQDELKKDRFTLKDLKNGEQNELTLDELINKFDYESKTITS